MTEGTSQGLFIVVAFVIFGIFAVLAYVLFEDTISPAMASMFSTATETASNRLTSWELIYNGEDKIIWHDKVSNTGDRSTYIENGYDWRNPVTGNITVKNITLEKSTK